MPDLGTAYVRVAGDFSDLNSKLVGVLSPQRLGKVGKVAGAALAGGVAAAGIGKVLFDVGKQFDDAFDQIRTQTGATGKELEGLKESFRGVVRSVPADFDTASKAVAGLHQRLDLTGRPLGRLSKQLVALSNITGSDIQENVESVTRLFGDWSVRTREQGRTLDRLFRLTQETGIEFSSLARLMVQFGSPLRQLGFQFDEAAVMFARFEREGVNMQTLLPGLRMALKNIAVPTEDLAGMFKRLGISTRDPHTALLQIFEVLSEDKVKEADQTLLASSVFGGRAWADMKAAVEEGRFEFEDLIRSMRGGEETIRGSERSTRDFSEQWTLFKNNLKLIVEPVAMRVFEGIGAAMKDVTDILRDPKLTSGEKLQKMLDLAGRALGKLTEKVAAASPKIAVAFVRAFINAPIWGKIATAALLIRVFGGKGAILGIGKRIGGWIAGQIAARMAATTVAEQVATNIMGGPAKGKWTGLGHRLGGVVGRAFGIGMATFGAILLWQNRKEIIARARDIADRITDAMGATTDVADVWGPRLASLTKRISDAGETITRKQAREFTKQARQLHRHGQFSTEHYNELLALIRDRTSRAEQASTRNLNQAADKGGRASKRLKDKVAGNVRSLADAVASGLENIRDNTNKSLGAFGVKKISFAISKGAGAVIEAARNLPKKQRGGLVAVAPGHEVGDKKTLSIDGVPVAKIESREGLFVGNRKLMAAVAAANEEFPRFRHGSFVDLWGKGLAHLAKGGMIRVPGDPDTTGGRDLVNSAIAQQVGAFIKRFGVQIGYAYDPGGGHQSPGHNVTGTALDIHPFSTGWDGVDRAVAAAVKAGKTVYYDGRFGSTNLPPHGRGHHAHIEWGMGGAVAGAAGAIIDQVKRVLLKGPEGPLRDMGQSALDQARKAANRYLSKQTMELGESAHTAGGAYGKSQLVALWRRANDGIGDANLMAAIALAESSGNPNAVSYADARGLWQIHWPAHASWASRIGSPFNPLANAKMAAHILQTQGLGAWDVYTGAGGGGRSYLNFMKPGGMLPPFGGDFAHGGVVPGPIGAPRTVVAHGGEHVGRPVVELHLNGDGASLLDDLVDEMYAIVDGERVEINRGLAQGVSRSRKLAGSAGRVR